MTQLRRPGRPRGSEGVQAKQGLLQAARVVMAEQGQAGLTVREVAERAGVQAPLVNYYFGDRAGLLDAVLEQLAGEIGARVRAAGAPGTPPRDRIYRLIRDLAELIGSERESLRLLFERVIFADDEITDRFVEKFARPQMEHLMQAIASGTESGDFRELDMRFFGPNLLGSVIFFFVAAPVTRRLFGMKDITPEIIEDFAQQTADLVLNGIRTRGSASK